MSQVAATMGITTEEIAAGSEEFDKLQKAAKEAGATEELKVSEPMEWVRRMEMCSLQVREVIMKELIYQ